MKCSFDFDGTLSETVVQQYARELVENNVEVWVVTTRYDENHKHKYEFNPTLDDLWEVVDRLKIPRWRVRFTCMSYKHEYLDDTPFTWHLDDNPDEHRMAVKNNCSVPVILVTDYDWKEQCISRLNQ